LIESDIEEVREALLSKQDEDRRTGPRKTIATAN
jgi:hypothetical protein